MAARFWVGGTGTWDGSDTSHWSATSGGASGASVPTSADDVTFDSASSGAGYTVTISGTASGRDVTFAAPAAGNVTVTSSGAWDVYGSFTLYSGLVWSFTGTLTFKATSTGKTITTAGTVLSSTLSFNGSGGGWTLQDSFTHTDGSRQVSLTAGTLDTNGKTVSITIFSSSGSSVRTLTLGASTLTVTVWTVTGSNLTLNAGTSTLNTFPTAGNTFAFGNFTYSTVNLMIGSYAMPSDSSTPTFGTLSITGSAGKLGVLTLGGNWTITGTLTIAGNSSVNRLLVGSTAKGTARTINSATNAISNADFQDITGAGAASWNLSAITGLSGDCGGNSGITFTTPATQYWQHGASASYNWDDSTRWFLATNGGGGAGRVPLPQDTARLDANSFAASGKTVVQNMPRIPATDWTGVTNTPTWTTSTAASFFGSITLVSGMTLTANTQTYTYEGRGASTLTSAGQTWSKALSIHCHSGTLSLGDAFTNAASSSPIIFDSGTFNSAGFSVTTFGLTYSTSSNQTLTMGGSLWTLTRGNSDPWGIPAAMTVNAGTSTIRLTGTFTAARSFGGAGKTYYNLENATAGAFALQITGSNTFNNIHIDASAAARTVLFTAGTTTTVTSFTRDTGTNIITLGSITAANHNLVKSGGGVINTLHHMSISRSQATPSSSTWYANIDSTDGGNNSGWIFGVIPPGFTTSATAALFTYVAKAGTTASTITRSATAAVFNFLSRPGVTRTTITVPATVASFLFRGLAAQARSVVSVLAGVASFAYSALAGSTSTTNPDPRNIAITVSLSPNPAIVVSRSSYSITVSE